MLLINTKLTKNYRRNIKLSVFYETIIKFIGEVFIMLFGKKAALLLSSAMLVSSLGACSSGISTTPVAVNGDVNFANSNLVTRISETLSVSKEDPNHFYIDAGKGEKTGVSFSVNLNFGGSKFNTKASASGSVAKVATDVTHIDIELVKSASAPTSIANLDTNGVITAHLARAGTAGTGAVNGLFPAPGTLATNGGTTTVITFTNINDGTYWVAAAALTGTTNIGALTLPANGFTGVAPATKGTGGTAIGAGSYFSSTFGGTGASGSVVVTKEIVGLKAQYVIQAGDTTPIGMNIPLLEAGGATIESSIKLDDGNHTFNATTFPVTVI